jgi:RNA 3'-terminal phosphate cyclase (ATP)
MIEIDGSLIEGGGQILRTALSFSAIFNKKIRIFNIRAKRNPPGLKAQHLAVCKLFKEITKGNLQGAFIGSNEVIFEPKNIIGGEYKIDIGTAGSVNLLFQAVLPALLFAEKPSKIVFYGGTHVRGAPTFEYIKNVFLPASLKFGVNCELNLLRAGFYPKGGGLIEALIIPSKLNGVIFEKVRQKNFYEIVLTKEFEKDMQKQKESIEKNFEQIEGNIKVVNALCPGAAITAWNYTLGSCAIINNQSQELENFVREFSQEISSDASVDSHLADQLLVFAAIAKGKTRFQTSKVSTHLLTNANLLAKLSEREIIIKDNIVEIN